MNLEACDVHETHRPALNISYHLPKGLQLYGYHKSASTNRNLAHLYEGQRVAILFDCNSHTPLYAATVITGSHLVDRRVLREHLIQNAARYPNIFSNGTRITQRGVTEKFVLKTWLPKNLIDLTSLNDEAIFVSTNTVLQFGDFNSAPWNTCERKLIKWGQENCVLQAMQCVEMFIVVVVAIPSTLFILSEMRHFGQSGFSAYQEDSEFCREYDLLVGKCSPETPT